MSDTFFQSFAAPLNIVIAAFVILGFGVLFRKKGWFPQTADTPLYNVTVRLLMPSLILDRVVTAEGLFTDIRNLYLPPLVGFGMTLTGIIAGFVLAAVIPKKLTGLDSRKTICTFAACAGILNYGFTPIPLVEILFRNDGGKTMGILFVQNLGAELSIWTIVVMTMGGRFSRSILKRAINPPTCAILLGVLLNYTGLGRFMPQFAANTLHLLGGASIPVSIFLIGLTFADLFDGKKILARWKTSLRIAVCSCLLRLVLLPALFLILLPELPCSIELKRVIVIHLAMPSAIFPLVLSKFYGGDEQTAMDVILPNNILSVLTTSFWVAFGFYLIGS
ncbi:MAG: AEC family transporter [Planctomycetaceae bacterium]|jgi:predicted permease|nr:AEC family transporter [Planctomycetaceae bacterium]